MAHITIKPETFTSTGLRIPESVEIRTNEALWKVAGIIVASGGLGFAIWRLSQRLVECGGSSGIMYGTIAQFCGVNH